MAVLATSERLFRRRVATMPGRRVPGLAAAALCCLAAGEPSDAPAIGFNRDVRPILADKCFRCHGPDSNARKAKLRLDLPEEAMRDRGGYRVIAPGDPEASRLVQKITAESVVRRMPPLSSNKTLSEREIDVLREWIRQGAAYEAHWAFVPPERPAVPDMEAPAEFRANPVDRFLFARMQEEGLAPSPPADRITLLRRVTFDLTGLPPTPAEAEAFLADASPGAYEAVVERLLASPHYGEAMAVGWLDLVRYADSVGYHADNERTVFPYRDYVIDAFNASKPFDDFTVEQLAGDLLEDPTVEQRIAAVYNRLNRITPEDGAQPLEYEKEYAADRVRTTSSVWMAATMACSQCHAHKFDPFATEDFYRFSAFFADIEEQAVYTHSDAPLWPPFMEVPVEDAAPHVAALEYELERVQRFRASPRGEQETRLDDTIRALQDEIESLRRGTVKMPATVAREAPRVTRVLPRGNWMDESGAVVEPGVPAFLGELPVEGRRATRLDLARWLVSGEHPLTGRAFVNRLWKQFFGRGLSRVLDDLGSQGEWPVQEELLDFLATEFVGSGWDVKHMVRLLVTSAAYRQSSVADPARREEDPGNVFVARQQRWRLRAEFVRDAALAVSGLLNPKVGGPSFKPYQPRGYWDDLNFPKRLYYASPGDEQYRRGLYAWWQRTFLHPSFLAFDAPTREECTAERTLSNSPQQALVLLNDPTFVECARVFAERIVREGSGEAAERVAWAFREALTRAPTAEEAAPLEELFGRHREYFAAHPEEAQALLATGQAPPPEGDPAELAAWTSVARVLFNLDEFITRP